MIIDPAIAVAVAIITDVVAITVLAYVLYFRRHRRRDLMLSYVALNTGVLAVTIALSSVEAGIGLGLGLFGILSIIRLRSDQITQQEIAYYFTALALGLLAGLHPSPLWLTPLLSTLMLTVMFVVDSPHVARQHRRQTITLDRAYADERELEEAVRTLLGASTVRVELLELDLVRETTLVDARYRLDPTRRPRQANVLHAPVAEPESASAPVENVTADAVAGERRWVLI